MLKHLLCRAKVELQSLRRENELLRAQVRVIDVIDRVTSPRHYEGALAQSDIIWEMDKAVAQIEAGESDKKETSQPVAQYREDKERPHGKLHLKTEDDRKKDW